MNAVIEAKRQRVRKAYSKHGVGSVEYEKEFDELHDMNMKLMASRWRSERGFSIHHKTPYCE